MTSRVAIFPSGALPDLAAIKTGRPVIGSQLSAFEQMTSHILGADLPQVIHNCWAKQENPIGAGTYYLRYQYWAHPNAERLAVKMRSGGYTSGTSGTIKVNGGSPLETVTTRIDSTDIAIDVGAATEEFSWLVEIATPGDWNELVIELTDCKPNALVAYQVPRVELTGTNMHVDGNIGSALGYITDDNVSSDPRGVKGLLQAIQDCRIEMRRHLVNTAWPYSGATGGLATSGASGYLLGSATSGDGLRVRSRDISGASVTENQVAIWLYVSDVGGSTFHFNVSTGAAGSPFRIPNAGSIGAAGWWGSAAGSLKGGQVLCNSLDTIKIQHTRDSGAGNAHVSAITIVEDL